MYSSNNSRIYEGKTEGKKDKSSSLLWDVNTPFAVAYQTSRQKISKDIKDLYNTTVEH